MLRIVYSFLPSSEQDIRPSLLWPICECLWLHLLSIVELTNYSCIKYWKAFYRNAFSFVAGLHNVGLLLHVHVLPISEQYFPDSNRVTYSEIGPHILDKTGHFSLMGHELITQGLFLKNCFISTTFYESLYTEKYELLKL